MLKCNFKTMFYNWQKQTIIKIKFIIDFNLGL